MDIAVHQAGFVALQVAVNMYASRREIKVKLVFLGWAPSIDFALMHHSAS
jgi:hypothetical protein